MVEQDIASDQRRTQALVNLLTFMGITGALYATGITVYLLTRIKRRK